MSNQSEPSYQEYLQGDVEDHQVFETGLFKGALLICELITSIPLI